MSQLSHPRDVEKSLRVENVIVKTDDLGGASALTDPPTLTPEEENRLWRKLDLRLLPILSLLYLFSFMDRGMLL